MNTNARSKGSDPHDSRINRAQSGDQRTLESLLREHVQQVSAICRRICLNQSDAEDATQEALIAISKGIERFDGRSSFSTWVHRVTTNACLDEIRRVKRRPTPIDTNEPFGDARVASDDGSSKPPPRAEYSDSDVERELERVEMRDQISDALAALPEDFRIAVVLRDVGDRSYDEIAHILDLKVGTVKSRIARGRALLGKSLRAKGTFSASESSQQGEEPQKVGKESSGDRAAATKPIPNQSYDHG